MRAGSQTFDPGSSKKKIYKKEGRGPLANPAGRAPWEGRPCRLAGAWSGVPTLDFAGAPLQAGRLAVLSRQASGCSLVREGGGPQFRSVGGLVRARQGSSEPQPRPDRKIIEGTGPENHDVRRRGLCSVCVSGRSACPSPASATSLPTHHNLVVKPVDVLGRGRIGRWKGGLRSDFSLLCV